MSAHKTPNEWMHTPTKWTKPAPAIMLGQLFIIGLAAYLLISAATGSYWLWLH